MRGIGIVPARGGSKRLKNKNMLHINGVPMAMVAYRTLRKAGLDKVIVATDIKELQSMVKLENFLWRPKELNGDDVSVHEVIRWAYKEQGRDYDYIVMLLANCPGFTGVEIKYAVNLLFKENLNVVRSYDVDGIENGLLVVKADYYMKNPVDVYCGGIITNAIEIHDKDDYKRAIEI